MPAKNFTLKDRPRANIWVKVISSTGGVGRQQRMTHNPPKKQRESTLLSGQYFILHYAVWGLNLMLIFYFY